MKTHALLIAASLAFAGPASAAETASAMTEAEMHNVMAAAGGVVTLAAVCPDIKLSPQVLAHIATLEGDTKRHPQYAAWFDDGVRLMTEEFRRNPGICEDVLPMP